MDAWTYAALNIERIYSEDTPQAKQVKRVWYQISQQGMTEDLLTKLTEAIESYLKQGSKV